MRTNVMHRNSGFFHKILMVVKVYEKKKPKINDYGCKLNVYLFGSIFDSSANHMQSYGLVTKC